MINTSEIQPSAVRSPSLKNSETIPSTIDPTSATTGSAKCIQCGWRSTATVSSSFNNFVGYGMGRTVLGVRHVL